MNTLRVLGIFLMLWKGDLAQSRELVSNEAIRIQKSNTVTFHLENQTPVTYRQIPSSEIVVIDVAFAYGEASLPRAERPGLGVLTDLMKRGSLSYPKEQLYGLLEKYGTGISCGFGIELGSCSMATLNRSLSELLPAFTSVMKEPTLSAVEAELVLEQAKASEAAALQNPESYVNEVVNQVFYGEGHPYWTPHQTKVKDLESISLDTLKALHEKLLRDAPKHIVVVGSLKLDELKKLLEANFGFFKEVPRKILEVPDPVYAPQKSYDIAVREIPTSYIRAKFLVPGLRDPQFIATQLMMHILSEELENEIRTKRSLSYSAYAQILPYTIGVGIIHASTSKPKETIEAIKMVIQKIRSQKLSVKELDRYRTVFATGYFLNLEEHRSLAGSLRSSLHYFGSADRLYDMPRLLAQVTPQDILKAARTYLKQFRLGVVYREKGFEPAWAEDFLKAFP